MHVGRPYALAHSLAFSGKGWGTPHSTPRTQPHSQTRQYSPCCFPHYYNMRTTERATSHANIEKGSSTFLHTGKQNEQKACQGYSCKVAGQHRMLT